MILSLIVIAFCIGMAVLWAGYGLFSALLHLCVVLAAGTIALAVWEPITVGFLLGTMPHYAWTVGLLGPFAVLLIVLRGTMDRLVRGNVQFHPLVDQILGGAVGAVSGVLTTGLAIIGLSFLPLPAKFLGYQPYEVKTNGTIAPPPEGASLWVPADAYASKVFGMLSDGGFWAPRGLSTMVGDLHKQAGTFRLGRQYDPQSSLALSPDTVTVDAVVAIDQPPTGLSPALGEFLTANAPNLAGPRLVAVTTTWKAAQNTATFDTDRILRVPPVQARLLTQADAGGPLQEHLPVGFSNEPVNGTSRVFYPVNDNAMLASVLGVPEGKLVWVYAVPSDQQARFIELRNVRMLLPAEVGNSNEAFVAAVGQSFDEQPTDAQPTEAVAETSVTTTGGEKVSPEMVGYATHRVIGLEENASLPVAISANRAGGLSIVNDKVRYGKDIVEKASRGTVRELEVSPSLRPIRLQIEPQAAISGLGQARDAASNIQEVSLQDANGRPYFALGYVLALADGRQEFNILDGDPMRNSSQFPLTTLKAGDRLYMYFTVPPGVTLTRYQVGQAYQELNVRTKP